MEQQVSKAEIQLKGLSDNERQWFQTMKQRRDEHERLTNKFKTSEELAKKDDKVNNNLNPDRLNKLSDSKRKKILDAEKKKRPFQTPKEKYKQGLEKSSLLRAKAMKSKKRPQKVNAVPEEKESHPLRKARVSKFAKDLTDTSRRGAKRLRYISYVIFCLFTNLSIRILTNN